jgi:hypothetical protein
MFNCASLATFLVETTGGSEIYRTAFKNDKIASAALSGASNCGIGRFQLREMADAVQFDESVWPGKVGRALANREPSTLPSADPAITRAGTVTKPSDATRAAAKPLLNNDQQ